MKRVITLESNKIKKDILIALLSDLHYNTNDKLNFLEKEYEKFLKENPDYILFLGDLLDDASIDLKDLYELRKIFEKIAKVCPTIMILGNHDGLTRTKTGWACYKNFNLPNMLLETGAVVLQNTSYNIVGA